MIITVEEMKNYLRVDSSDDDAEDFALSLADKLNNKYKIRIKCIAEYKSTDADKTISVGKSDGSLKKLAETMANKYDFAVKIEKDSLLLCAQNEISYNYLEEYLLREVFVELKDGVLTLDSEDDIVYSSSELFGVSYPEYWREENGLCTKAFMLDIFESKVFSASNGINMPYRIYLPFDYVPEKEYPVLIFLHGAGHRGSDNIAPVQGIVHAMFDYDRKDAAVDGSIVIVPQCPSGLQWVDHPWSQGNYSTTLIKESKAMVCAVELIKSVIDEYSADEKRVFVIGLSMGGYGAWDIVTRHPDMFAAAIPMCGGGDPSKVSVLKDIPIWAAHGAADPSVSVQNTRTMVQKIKSAGGSVVNYIEYPSMGHDIGTHTLRQANIMKWLYEQHK